MLTLLASTVVRPLLRLGGRLSGRQRASFAHLRPKAGEVRAKSIGKEVGKGNVAVLEYCSLDCQMPISVEATSRGKSPAPKPQPRSQGGYFEPSIDPSTNRLMDTDASTSWRREGRGSETTRLLTNGPRRDIVHP